MRTPTTWKTMSPTVKLANASWTSSTHFAPQNQLPTFAGATLTTTRDDELAIAVAMGGGGASAPFIDEPGTSSGVAYAVIPARGTVLAPTWARTSNTQTTDWLITFKSGW